MIPTRELALQITTECKKFTKAHGLKVVCVYGGTGISEQIAELKRGCEIIVCTPGRMIDMLTANNGQSFLYLFLVMSSSFKMMMCFTFLKGFFLPPLDFYVTFCTYS